MTDTISSIILVGIFAIIFPAVFVFTLRSEKSSRDAVSWGKNNLPVIADILGCHFNPESGRDTVRGTYNNRPVIFRLAILHSNSLKNPSSTYRIKISMIPWRMPRKMKPFIIKYPRPTRFTSIYNDAVNFRFESFAKLQPGNTAPWGRSVFIAILEELAQAAEIVERDQKFYQGSMGELKGSDDLARYPIQNEQQLAVRKKEKQQQIFPVIILLIIIGGAVFAIVWVVFKLSGN